MKSNELNGYKQPKTLADWQLALWETNVEKGWRTLKRTTITRPVKDYTGEDVI